MEMTDVSLPFTAVQSAGGPYQDEAYLAGYEMGAVEASVKASLVAGERPRNVFIRPSNLHQLDLLAMKFGMALRVSQHPAAEGRLYVSFVQPV